MYDQTACGVNRDLEGCWVPHEFLFRCLCMEKPESVNRYCEYCNPGTAIYIMHAHVKYIVWSSKTTQANVVKYSMKPWAYLPHRKVLCCSMLIACPTTDCPKLEVTVAVDVSFQNFPCVSWFSWSCIEIHDVYQSSLCLKCSCFNFKVKYKPADTLLAVLQASFPTENRFPWEEVCMLGSHVVVCVATGRM